MARLARVVVAGIPHHVTQRGNRRQATFFEDGDYDAYLSLMAEWCGEFGVAVWAYCLMPNHVHLIAVPETADGFGQGHRRVTPALHPADQSATGMARASLAGPLRLLPDEPGPYSRGSALHRTQSRQGRAGRHPRRLSVEQRPGSSRRQRRPAGEGSSRCSMRLETGGPSSASGLMSASGTPSGATNAPDGRSATTVFLANWRPIPDANCAAQNRGRNPELRGHLT